ncbi:hypothetical protein BWI84_27770 (plasmid) [Escherichia coli]|nr:hypothetical protein BWI84_27770 [Escherichia coli]
MDSGIVWFFNFLYVKRLLLSPGNTSILPENIVGQSLSVGFRPLPQTTPKSPEKTAADKKSTE